MPVPAPVIREMGNRIRRQCVAKRIGERVRTRVSVIRRESAASPLRAQRMHSMATYSSQLLPLQPRDAPAGTAPVMSFFCTLR